MTTDSLLFIPDISGFTEFVNETEITHSRHVVSELLEAIIEADDLGMTVSEIEGDAVVFFLRGRTPGLPELLEQARRTFEAFHTHLKRYERDRICPCGACQTAHRLSLKMVAHCGPPSSRTAGKPYGSDVILAHQLLKNDVEDHEYLLVTEELGAESGTLPSWVTLVPGTTTYDSLGPVSYHHIPLGLLKPGVPDPPDRVSQARSRSPITKEVHVPLPLAETFELISNFDQRLLWNREVDDLRYDPDRVNKVGTRHQCLIDGDLIDFETVTGDFGPDRLIYGERVLSDAPVLDLTLYYIMEEEASGTRVCAEVHYQAKTFPKSILAIPFRFVFAKQLSKSLAAIAKAGASQTAF